MNGKRNLTQGFVPLLLPAVINFALIKEEIDFNVRHKNHGVDGSPLDSQSVRDLKDEKRWVQMWLAEVPYPAEPGYFCKKHLKSDIGKGAFAGAARPKRLQFQF